MLESLLIKQFNKDTLRNTMGMCVSHGHLLGLWALNCVNIPKEAKEYRSYGGLSKALPPVSISSDSKRTECVPASAGEKVLKKLHDIKDTDSLGSNLRGWGAIKFSGLLHTVCVSSCKVGPGIKNSSRRTACSWFLYSSVTGRTDGLPPKKGEYF